MSILFNQALNTYKAIHGFPFREWTPWYNASDTPFNGMPVELVSELCDKREVAKYMRGWRNDHTPKTLNPKGWVNTRSIGRKIKEGYLVDQNISGNEVVIVASLYEPKMEFFNKIDLKPIATPPGARDLLELGLGRDLKKYEVGAEVTASTFLRRKYNMWDKVIKGVVEYSFIIPEGYDHYVDEHSAVPCGSVRWETGLEGLYRHMIYDIVPT